MPLLQKRNIIIGLILILVLVVGYSGFAAARTANDPGSVDDPLVTRSFVETYVQKYMESAPAAGGTASLEWGVAELETGQEFIGKSGTEFIVRSGSAVVVDPSGSGIVDLTAGKNVLAGQTAVNNHLFTIPKTDGRGINAQKPTIIMYRGF